jgi:hypothetical protein
MKVRIKSHGPLAWQISVQDVETGIMLPVLWDEDHVIEIRQRDGMLYARVDIAIDEIDVEAPADLVGKH